MSGAGLPLAMGLQKLWRKCGTALQDDGFAVVDARPMGNGHLAVFVERQGQRARLTLPSSPSNADHTIRLARQTARRLTRTETQ